jgi:hypothetical protein
VKLMPEAISNIGNFFSNPAFQNLLKVGELGATGAGLVGNILNERSRSQELNKLKSAEATLADPAKLSSEVRAATQPLDQGLVSGVENAVSGSLAERGLSQAPGIQAATISGALAPYQQQNQNTALQLVLTRLGLPLQYAQTILQNLPKNTNLAPLLALLGRTGGTPDTSVFSGEPYNIPDINTSTPTSDVGDFSLPQDIFA